MKKPLLFCLLVWIVLFALPWTRGQALLDWRGATVGQFSGDIPAWAPLDAPYLPETDAYNYSRSGSQISQNLDELVKANGLEVAPQFAAMARSSTDRDVLVWCALSPIDSKAVARNMAVIEARFPGDVSLLAWKCGTQIQNLSMTTRVPGPLSSPTVCWSVQTNKTPGYPYKVDDKARPQWDAVVVEAHKGQKMEPRNGFWWWLEAMALLGARRDEQVWPVLRVGSSKTQFDDYSTDRLLALRRAHLKTQGVVPIAFYIGGERNFSWMFYSRWREVARQVCENVMGARLLGRHKTALEGGRDMVMMGRLLRRSSDSISVLVGIAIENIALRSALPPASSTFKRLVPGANAAALAGHPTSLLRYANELNRKDIALQITNEWNAVTQARKAQTAKTKAALTSTSSQIQGVSDATATWAGGSQNTGALLVQTLPIPILEIGVLSVLLLVARRRPRDDGFVLPAWTRGLGWSAFALVVLFAAQTLFGSLSWKFLSYSGGWTTYWGFYFLLPRLVVLLPLWAFAFAACVAGVGAVWATVFAARRAQGEASLGARLMGIWSAPDERTGALNLGPILQLIALMGVWSAFAAALGAWFYFPQEGALETQSTDTLHDQYAGMALALFCLVPTILAILFRAKGYGVGTYFRGWLEVTRRFLVAHLVLTTVLYLLLATSGAFWSARFDAEWLKVNAPPKASATSAKP
ncbi:hypothetical protein IAD21_03654 [Abditibacteriota bacterium]|nr:hypothetical protein IAD21_03654 [Abditibacteriota bacterium]